jgi:Na+/melibiose symporter-like transporter
MQRADAPSRSRLSSCCATTPSAACFWTIAFLLTYSVTLAVRSVWPALNRFGDALLLSALGLACVLNTGRNRTYHCVLTGPLFVGGAIVAALTEAGVWHVRPGLLWSVIIVGVAAALVAEWRATHAQQNT